MAEEITLKVNVETGQAVGSLNKLDKVTGEVVKETNEMVIATSKSAKTLGDLEKASEDLTIRLKGAKFGTPEFKELNQALKDVNRQVKNTELNMEALDNEQVASEIGSVAGAVGDMTTAFILLGGDDNSALAATVKNIEKALGVSMAFKGAIEGFISFQKLWNNVIKETAVIQAITNKTHQAAVLIMKLMGKTAGMSTKAFKLLKGAIAAVGIGLVITGIQMLIENFDKIVGAVKSALSWLGLYDDSAEKSAKKREQRLAKEKTQRENRLKQIENSAKREQALHDQRITGLDNEIKIAKSLGKTTVELERQKLEAVILFHKGQKPLIEESIRLKRKEIEIELIALEVGAKRHGNWLNFEGRIAEQKQLLLDLDDEKIQATQAIENAEVSLLVFENEIQLEKRKIYKKTAEENKKVSDKEIEDAQKAADDKLKIEKDLSAKLLEDEIKLEDQQWQLLQELTNTEQEFELLKLAQQYDKKNALAVGNAELINLLKEQEEKDAAAIDKKYRDKDIERAQAVKDAKTQMALDGLNAIMSLTDAFTKDNEKSQKRAFEINKKLQIAQALIQTYQGVQAIFAAKAASPETILFPAAPFIAAGIALATGLANVQNIRKQQFSGGASGGSFGGGGGVPGGGGGAAPQIEPVTNTSTLVPQGPQQVYVTETDISATQNKVNVIEAQSTF